MQRKSLEIVLAAALTALTGCGSGVPRTEPFAAPVVVEIEAGLTSRQIAETLQATGIIRSKWAFLAKRALNRKTVLMAGEYEFVKPLPVSEAFGTLAAGRVKLYPLTIPEGYSRFEVADKVASSGLASREEFLRMTADPGPVKDILPAAESLEGCLFPDTYNLARTSTADDLLAAMVARFREVLAATRKQQTTDLSDWETLILASMIEKETGIASERKLVASVFHNRVRKRMMMQCDPTIVYGLLREDRYRGKIYRSDLQNPHPYNTYIHAGLPPGPIANPGKAALEAAFSPAETDYLFFVAKPGDGKGHLFSKTMRAHQKGVAALRRGERAGRRR